MRSLDFSALLAEVEKVALAVAEDEKIDLTGALQDAHFCQEAAAVAIFSFGTGMLIDCGFDKGRLISLVSRVVDEQLSATKPATS